MNDTNDNRPPSNYVKPALDITPLKTFCTNLIHELVENPKELLMQWGRHGNTLELSVTAPPKPLGMLIGRNGETVEALKKICLCVSRKYGYKIRITLCEQEYADSNNKPSTT